MTNYRDEDYALFPKDGSGFGFKTDTSYYSGQEQTETEGLVETPQGIVRAFSFYHGRRQQGSTLRLIKNGRTYYRSFDKCYTQRGLVTKAKQFAKSLENNDG